MNSVHAIQPEPRLAQSLLLEVKHQTRYAYAQTVAQSHHIAYLQPLGDESQTLLDFEVIVDPEPAFQRLSRDGFGNLCRHFALSRPHRELTVSASSLVRVASRFAQLQAGASPPWERIRDRLRYVARAAFDPAVEFVQPSPFVPRLDALRALAAPLFRAGRPAAEAALELMERIYGDFEYAASSTQIETPVAEVLAQRAGVCQDFAHVMIGACRMMGLPARYVSGYLLTQGVVGGQALVGADASHAWVQVYVPGTPGVPTDGWLDLDPTNRLVPGAEHVRLAVGRDFGDVTPLRGVIRGGGKHTLHVGVTTREWLGPVPAGPFVAIR